MNLDQIETKSFIMALFIRDDNERFLLGTGAYEFKDSQLHFAGNTIENDVVSIQGNDGYMLAGQVRRPNTQVFDGYIGDATTTKSEVEGFRRDFFAFFRKNHFYTVVYIMADGSAIQRRKGFLVDAPTVKELWQMYPEYHVGFNFEDINYYNYTENAQGEETYGKSADVGLAKAMYGGLIWEEDGITTVSGTGTNITLAGTMEGGAIESVELNGDTTQTTISGKNLYEGSPDFSGTWNNEASWTTSSQTFNGMVVKQRAESWAGINKDITVTAGKTYTFSVWAKADTARTSAIYPTGAGATATVSTSGKDFNITTSWQRYSLTFSVSVSGTVRLRFENKTSLETYTYIAGYQLEENNSMTSFEPYVGGTASPNPDYPQNVNVVTGEQSIEVHAKNLFNVSLYDGITQNTDGTVKSTKYYTATTAVSLHLEPSTRYTISIRNSNGELNGQGWGIAVNGTWINTTSGTGAVTTDANGDVTLAVGASSYGAIGGYNAFFQLEKGNQATTYEPYKGVTKTVNLGKNLFDNSAVQIKTNASFTGTDGNVFTTSSSDYRDLAIVKVQPNTKVTLSINDTSTYPNTRFYVVGLRNTTTESGESFSWLSGTSTITTGKNTNYLGVIIQPRDSSNNTPVQTQEIVNSLKIQFEFGDAKTTYAPYFTPIELCKIGTYQDYIYKSGEDWYIHKDINKVLLDGTQYVTQYATATANKWRFTCSVYGAADVSADVIVNMSDKFVGVTRGDTWNNKNGVYQLSGGVGFYWEAIAGYTREQVVTWLGSNSFTAYYPLATPTDTQITNATLISELEGLLSATTYSGNT